jgi:hypothetical protein
MLKYTTLGQFNKGMMKRTITILVVFFSCSICFSQTTIDLKTGTFAIENQNFYIDKVFDDSPERHLGVVEDNSNKKVKMHFENGTASTIKQFMDAILPKTSDRVPITLRVNNLKVEQAQTSIAERTARVYIQLSFFSESEEALYKVVHYEVQIFPVADLTEINKTHEQRIRAALEYCLWKFINEQKVNTSQNLINGGTMSKASVTQQESTFELYVPLGRWFNMLTFKKTTDRYSEGWNVAYTGFSDNGTDLIIPFVIGYGQSRATSNVLQERGYSSANSFALGFGLNGYLKIIPGLYADLGINVPIGMEFLRDLEDRKSMNFLIGVGTHQGVKIIPWQDFGIVIGAGLFQRWQTSELTNKNFGFELELGINF